MSGGPSVLSSRSFLLSVACSLTTFLCLSMPPTLSISSLCSLKFLHNCQFTCGSSLDAVGPRDRWHEDLWWLISQDESAPRAVHHWKPLPPAVLVQSPEQEPNLTSSSSVWTPLRTKILQIKQEQIHNIKVVRTTMKLSTRGLKDVFTCGVIDTD